MPEGSWVAVTMRKPSNKEREHYTPWLGNRLGTAVPTHSTSPTAVVVSITGDAARDRPAVGGQRCPVDFQQDLERRRLETPTLATTTGWLKKT
jgi:hypothetical protein